VRRYGWQKGQRVTLKGTLRPVDLTFTIAGTISFHTDQAAFMLHREYLEEAMGRPGLVSFFWVEAETYDAVPSLMTRIDRTFESSPDPVKTMTQKQMLLNFLGLLGDVRGIVAGIGLLVMIAVLFITLNSIALSARERTREVAVLKAIGFTGRDVMVSMLFEAAFLALAGGAAGAVAAFVVFRQYALGLGFGPLSGFQASPTATAIGIAAALATGVLAALVPAVRAARMPIVEALRRAD
jgi:putative ABC transport system permease protein